MRNVLVVLAVCVVPVLGGCETAEKVGDAFATVGKATATGTVTAGKAVGKAGETVGKTVAKPFTEEDQDDQDD